MATRQNRETVSFPLLKGVDRGSDPKIVQDKLLNAINAEFSRSGSVTKRPGTSLQDTLSDDFTLLSQFNNAPVALGENLYTWEGDGFTDVPSPRGLLLPTAIDTKPILPLGNKKIIACDVAEEGNIRAVAYTIDTGSGFIGAVKTFNIASGTEIDSLELTITSGSTHAAIRPIRLVATGSGLLFLYIGPNDALLRFQAIDDNGAIQLSPVKTLALAIDPPYFDAVSLPTTGYFGLAFLLGTGLSYPTGYVCSYNGSAITTLSSASDTGYTGGSISCCVWGPTSIGYAAANATVTGAQAYVLDESGVIASPASVGTLTDEISSLFCVRTDIDPLRDTFSADGTLTLVTNEEATEFAERIITEVPWTVDSGTGDITDNGSPVQHIGFDCIGRPFLDVSGNLLAPALLSASFVNEVTGQAREATDDQRQGCLLSLDADVVVGKWLPGSIYFDIDRIGIPALLPQVQVLDDDQYLMGTLRAQPRLYDKSDQDLNDNEHVHGWYVRIDRSGDSLTALQTDKGLVIPNSVPLLWDGVQLSEQGFSYYPDLTIARTGTGTHTLETGAYQYLCCYCWYDNQGLLHRSIPGQPRDITTTGSTNQLPELNIRTLQGSRRSNVFIEVYRTLVSDNIFYFLKRVDNDPSVSFVTTVDSTADDDLKDNRTLYTTGGVLECTQPPQYDVATIHNDRLYYVDAEHSSTLIYYTQPPVRGFESETFCHSDVLVINVRPDGGPIIALASLNDRLIIFKKDRVLATHGTARGFRGELTDVGQVQPYYISTSIGCKSQQSVVRTGQGIIFQSNARDSRMYLIDESMKFIPVGEPVRYDTGRSTVTDAALLSGSDSVVFTSENETLVYNHFFNQWTLWDTTFENVRSVEFIDEVLWVLDGNSKVYKTDDSLFTDNNEFYAMRLETGWIHFGTRAPGGWIRCWNKAMIGEALSDHTLKIDIAYNNQLKWVDHYSFTPTNFGSVEGHYAMNGISADDYELRFRGSKTRIKSVRLAIYDEATIGSSGESWSATSLSFEVEDTGLVARKSNIAATT